MTKKIVTHDGVKVEAIVCEYLCEVENKMKEYDVICIDEIQFYKDAHIFCDKWANEGKIVIACGVNGTFERKSLKMISILYFQQFAVKLEKMRHSHIYTNMRAKKRYHDRKTYMDYSSLEN